MKLSSVDVHQNDLKLRRGMSSVRMHEWVRTYTCMSKNKRPTMRPHKWKSIRERADKIKPSRWPDRETDRPTQPHGSKDTPLPLPTTLFLTFLVHVMKALRKHYKRVMDQWTDGPTDWPLEIPGCKNIVKGPVSLHCIFMLVCISICTRLSVCAYVYAHVRLNAFVHVIEKHQHFPFIKRDAKPIARRWRQRTKFKEDWHKKRTTID